MQLKNTQEKYGAVAKALHWAIALLFLLAYCSVYYRQWFTEPKTTANQIALHLHLSAGISVFILVWARIVWRFMNVQPKHEPGPRWAHWAADIGHFALYAVMIIAPVTGYLGTYVGAKWFFLFQLPAIDDFGFFTRYVTEGLGTTLEEFEKPIDFLHKQILGAKLVWLLIVGHIAAALFHHFKLKDRTLQKMTWTPKAADERPNRKSQ